MEQIQEQKMEESKHEQRQEDKMIRILATDIEGGMQLYPGLAKIKGVSWGLSNAVCNALKYDKRKKIGSLKETDIKKISEFIKNPKVPKYLLNRRQDFDSGEDKHLVSSDLELQKDFDLKRLKKIKTYRGFRHMAGLPSRGQRTKSNFRKNRGKSVGIKKKKKVKTVGK